MRLRTSIFFLLIALTSLMVNAAFIVHDLHGKVSVIRKTGSQALTKDMTLTPNEKIEISANSDVQIFNTITKEIYTCDKPGQTTVMDIMISAKKSASENISSINRYVRFGSQGPTNTRRYTEGSVKRAMQTYDPEGANMSVEPQQLAVNVLANLANKNSATEMPVTVSHAPLGETGLSFGVENTLDFPIYLNVLKVDENGNIGLSELGQPTGCFVLLPKQAMSREHFNGLNPATRHILIITHCKFDIDDMLSSINELRESKDKLTPDLTLPVYQLTL